MSVPTSLEIVVNKWADVRAENERDKELIDPEQREGWEKFEKQTTAKLKEIIQGYDGNELTDTDKDWLQQLMQTIEKARQVSREELEKQKEEREAEEARKRQEAIDLKAAEERRAQEIETAKSGLLGLLG